MRGCIGLSEDPVDAEALAQFAEYLRTVPEPLYPPGRIILRQQALDAMRARDFRIGRWDWVDDIYPRYSIWSIAIVDGRLTAVLREETGFVTDKGESVAPLVFYLPDKEG